MAEFRTIRMAFWTDPYIEELEPKAKLLYIYLFTCLHTNNLGIIETTRRKIAFETGIAQSDTDKIIAKFEEDGKVVCDSERNLIFVTRFIRHQCSTSPRLMEGLQKIAPSIPSEKIAKALCILYPQVFGVSRNDGDTVSIPYADGTYTLSIPSGELGIWNMELGSRNMETGKGTVSGKQSSFVPPTIDEVREYCIERNNGIDPEKFIAFYASKGWMVGRNKMKDWKSAVITWEKDNKPKLPEKKKPWEGVGNVI